MKNYLFLLLLISLSFTACRNCEDLELSEEYVSTEEKEVAIEELKADIIALNSEYPEQVVTKAGWWKYILTALVDGGACYVSLQIPILQYASITCAIAASNRFFDWIDNKKVESAPLLDNSISMTYLQKEEWTGEGSSAGILHNTVITNLYDKYGEKFYEAPDTIMACRIAKEVSVLTNQDSTLLYLSLIDNFDVIKECVDSCTTDTSIHEYIAFLKRRFPENSQQLTIFEPILEGLQKVNPIENKGEYVDRVMCIIDSSAVAEPIKHNLREGLTVANASARLWNTEYVMVKE